MWNRSPRWMPSYVHVRPPARPRSPALAGRLVRVLSELGLVVLDRDGPALQIVERPARTALESSAAFRAYHRRLEDGLRYLTSDTIRQAA